MITHENLKSKVVKSGWPTGSVEAIQSALPSIGPLALNYLYTNFNNLGAPEDLNVPRLLAQFSTWRSEIQSGDSTSLTNTLANVLDRGNRTYIELLSCFVYDIHANAALAAKLDPDLNRRLFLYQFANLEEVPAKEVIWALTYYAADLAMVLDLESELKRFSYYKNYTSENKEFLKFREALEYCEQLLTDQKIPIGDESLPGTVMNFIHDFREFTISLPPRSSSYGVANYVTGAAAIKLLDKPGLLALRRILEVYAWFLEGILTEQEIKEYESERQTLLAALPDIIANTVSPAPSVDTAPPISSPRPEPTPLAANAPQRYVRELEPQRTEPTPLPNQFKIDSITPSQASSSKPTPPLPVPTPTPTPTPTPAPHKPPVAAPSGIHNQPTEITNPAKIHELINHPPANTKRGVVRDDTNIKISEEQQRLEKERAVKASQIQQKLIELRDRNKLDQQ